MQLATVMLLPTPYCDANKSGSFRGRYSGVRVMVLCAVLDCWRVGRKPRPAAEIRKRFLAAIPLFCATVSAVAPLASPLKSSCGRVTRATGAEKTHSRAPVPSLSRMVCYLNNPFALAEWCALGHP